MKEKILKYLKMYRLYIIIGGLLILMILVFLNQSNYTDNGLGLSLNEEKVIVTADKIKVDIKGAVVNPGVYEIAINSRVSDAIEVSGGLTVSADTSTINLSKQLIDEDVIIIYTLDDINEMRVGSTSVKYIDNECICPQITNDACIDNVITNIETIEDNKSETKTENALININTASLDTLMTLTGIGQTKGNAIIEYRKTNGNFKSIDEISNVSGIGKATYEKIKDNITV